MGISEQQKPRIKSTGYLTIELFSSREMNLRAIILYISLASHPKSNKANFSNQTLKHRNMSTGHS